MADGTGVRANGRGGEGGDRGRERSWPPPTSFAVDAAHLGGKDLPHEQKSPGKTQKTILRVQAERLRVAEVAARVSRQELAVPGPNHGATGYPEWLAAAAADEWEVGSGAGESGEGGSFRGVGGAQVRNGSYGSYPVRYTLGWEPYVIVSKKRWRGMSAGMFDERFRVRGWDKAAFIYEVATLVRESQAAFASASARACACVCLKHQPVLSRFPKP
jgi:hypothetical protein